MILHADYFSPAHSRIRIFEDRIEFYNPGGLPKPLQELKQKDLSIPRNPILAKLFRMVRIAENAGYGFDKMESNWKDYMDSEVIYETSFDSTIIVFPLIPGQNRKTKAMEQESRWEMDRRRYGDSSEKLRESFDKNLRITDGLSTTCRRCY